MELYHVLNRGVDKRSIALNDRDRMRFVHGLYEFNDAKPAGSTYHSFSNLDFVSPDWDRPRDPLVDIHGWCLMGNHYHLLLSEKVDGGLTQFLRKFNIGYSKYFNEAHKRSGALYQGRTKKILIDRDSHYMHILNYIHLNPLDFLKGSESWRERRIEKGALATAHLASYRWSSYHDYCGTPTFPSIITMNEFAEIFPDYRKEIQGYLASARERPQQEYTLE